MDKPVAAAPTGAKEKVEKQARQLAYDVRYKTKQSMAQKSGGRLDPAQVQKAYMSQLAKSPAPPAVKSRAKQMLMGEDYKAGIDKLVSDSAASALFKVFVEHHQKDKDGNTVPHEGEELNEGKMPEGLKNYLMKKKGKKEDKKDMKEGVGTVVGGAYGAKKGGVKGAIVGGTAGAMLDSLNKPKKKNQVKTEEAEPVNEILGMAAGAIGAKLAGGAAAKAAPP